MRRGLGFGNSVEGIVLGAIRNARPAISSASAEYASSAWKTVAAAFKKDPSLSIKDVCLGVAGEYADTLMESFAPGTGRFAQTFVRPVVNSMKDGVTRAIAAAMEHMALKKISDAVSLDRERLRAFWKNDFTTALREGLVSDIIAEQAKKAMAPLYFKIKLIFALLMLPVAMETGFAVYRRRKTAACSCA